MVGQELSVTVICTGVVPVASGVPEITPSGASEIPGGKPPLVSCQVYGVVPPVGGQRRGEWLSLDGCGPGRSGNIENPFTGKVKGTWPTAVGTTVGDGDLAGTDRSSGRRTKDHAVGGARPAGSPPLTTRQA